MPPDPATGIFERFDARCADALAELAGVGLADDASADPDRATVVVHIDAASGRGELDNGVSLSPDTIEESACGCRRQHVFEAAERRPVGVGRTTRQIPPWLERMVRKRDVACRFPAVFIRGGCTCITSFPGWPADRRI